MIIGNRYTELFSWGFGIAIALVILATSWRGRR